METTLDPNSLQLFTVSSNPFSLASINTRLHLSFLANTSAVAFANPEPTPEITATFPFSDSDIF